MLLKHPPATWNLRAMTSRRASSATHSAYLGQWNLSHCAKGASITMVSSAGMGEDILLRWDCSGCQGGSWLTAPRCLLSGMALCTCIKKITKICRQAGSWIKLCRGF